MELTSISNAQIKKASFIVTTVIGLAVVVFALRPPDLIVWLNLFAFGGLEAVFIWSVVLGLYWQKANRYGAIASMFTGMTMYIVIDVFAKNAFGMHSVTLPIIGSLLVFVIVSVITHHKVAHEPNWLDQ